MVLLSQLHNQLICIWHDYRRIQVRTQDQARTSTRSSDTPTAPILPLLQTRSRPTSCQMPFCPASRTPASLPCLVLTFARSPVLSLPYITVLLTLNTAATTLPPPNDYPHSYFNALDAPTPVPTEECPAAQYLTLDGSGCQVRFDGDRRRFQEQPHNSPTTPPQANFP